MGVVVTLFVFLAALAWKWLSYSGLFPGEVFRTISLVMVSLVVPLLLLTVWYLALFVLDRSTLSIGTLQLRLLELGWIAVVIFRLRYPIIEARPLPAIDNIFSIALFVALIVFRRWITESVNKIFEYYERPILAEFGLSHSAPRDSFSVPARLAIFLLAALILALVF